MMDIPNESKARGLRKYLYEYVLIALAGCVVYLFTAYHNMNAYVAEKLTTLLIENRITIEKNTDVINRLINQK